MMVGEASVARETIPRALLLAMVLGAAAETVARTYPVFATGNTLRIWCLGKGAVRASCAGYLAGVVDSLRGGEVVGGRTGEACLPPKLAPEQVRLLFLDHLNRNPGAGGRAAATVVQGALLAAFPCDSTAPDPARGKERISSGPDPFETTPLGAMQAGGSGRLTALAVLRRRTSPGSFRPGLP